MMENKSGIDVQSVWKMLDEMAMSDPTGYKKLIAEQMNAGKNVCSQPVCRGIQKFKLKSGDVLSLNICEWEMLTAPKSASDAIPMYCGDTYKVDNVLTACVAVHSTVFDQFGIPKEGKIDNANYNSSPEQLIGLILVYLAKEKSIVTDEFKQIDAGGDLPTFKCSAKIEPYGGVELMLKSLHFKEMSFEQLAKDCISNTHLRENSPEKDILKAVASTGLPEIGLNINSLNSKEKNTKKLIQEIIPDMKLPRWIIDENKRLVDKFYRYFINLPPNITTNDCQLDVSKKQLSLKIKKNDQFPDAFVIDFVQPVQSGKAKAKMNKKTNKLIVSVPLFNFKK